MLTADQNFIKYLNKHLFYFVNLNFSNFKTSKLQFLIFLLSSQKFCKFTSSKKHEDLFTKKKNLLALENKNNQSVLNFHTTIESNETWILEKTKKEGCRRPRVVPAKVSYNPSRFFPRAHAHRGIVILIGISMATRHHDRG